MFPFQDHGSPVLLAGVIGSASRHMGVVLALRLAYPAAFSVFNARLPAFVRSTCVVPWIAMAAFLSALGARQTIAALYAGLIYYLAIALLVRSRVGLWWSSTPRLVLFSALAVLTLAIPGLLAPRAAKSVFLIAGWELLFSSYSFLVERGKGVAADSTFGEDLFFLLADPTLAYPGRSKALDWSVEDALKGVSRVGFGVLLMWANTVAFDHLPFHRPRAMASGLPAEGAEMLLAGLVALSSLYAAHSGLAHIQIGVMRALAWKSPERYDRPFLAKSPMEFWQRWNRYMSEWLERYVFVPLGVFASRRRHRRTLGLLAVVATFVASGLVHDAYLVALRGALVWRYTRLFLLIALVTVAWRVLTPLIDRLMRAVPRGSAPARMAPHVAMVAVFVFFGTQWIVAN